MWGYYSRGGARAAKGALASPGNNDEDILQSEPQVRSKGILRKISISGGFRHQGTARGSYGEAQQAALLEAGIQQTFKADNGKGGNNAVRQLGLAWPQERGLTGKKLCFPPFRPAFHFLSKLSFGAHGIKCPAQFSPEFSSGTRTDPTQRRRAASPYGGAPVQ